jgi:tRNA(fMet)-specific endonuclease VapC
VKYLLDSGQLAAALKGRLPVVLKLSRLKPGDVAVSVLGRLEIEAALRRTPRLQTRFGRLLREFLASVPVLDVDGRVAQQAGTVAVHLGPDTQLSGFDLLTAATALAHQLILVTERRQDYAVVPGLEIETWR